MSIRLMSLISNIITPVYIHGTKAGHALAFVSQDMQDVAW